MVRVVAIDGPAGSGKGTIAQYLSDRFHLAYLDTGLLYRIAAYFDIAQDKITSVQSLLDKAGEIDLKELRTEEVGKKASVIAKNLQMREIMTDIQRAFACNPGELYNGAILDGRDIGSVVVPDAACKLFVTASLEIRAQRRLESFLQSGKATTFQKVYDGLNSRDLQDKTREFSPLTFDKSYVIIDTSFETIEESCIKVAKIVEAALISVRI